jgi:hypothetical protein
MRWVMTNEGSISPFSIFTGPQPHTATVSPGSMSQFSAAM